MPAERPGHRLQRKVLSVVPWQPWASVRAAPTLLRLRPVGVNVRRVDVAAEGEGRPRRRTCDCLNEPMLSEPYWPSPVMPPWPSGQPWPPCWQHQSFFT
mmetsp:Transcript_51129/g.111454  ORF Transcript_51129/g.111454 Transcript_51129/m.111454 type:complete len:99 (-) Transcript_51129:921-1217(-)